MTINDLCCDVCGRYLPTPDGGVRFVYHPGIPELRDDSGLACPACWADLTGGARPWEPSPGCAVCGGPVPRRASLHLRRFDDPAGWRLCAVHAVRFLNTLRTVEPKLDPVAFRFPGQ